jgi:hypothetical protein
MAAPASPFDPVPEAVVRYIFSFLPDHGALCSLELTCPTFRAISLEPPLWEALQKRRWNLPGSFGYSKNAYVRRHVMEREVTTLIRTLARTRDADELKRGFQVILRHTDVMETVDTTFRQSQNELRHISKGLLRLLHCIYALQRLAALKLQAVDDGERMEESIIAINRIFFVVQGPLDTCSPSIRNRLNEIANDIRSRFPSSNEELPPQDKLKMLNQVLFREMEFAVDMQEESLHLWLPHACLQNRIARPLILAVLYKSIARRIGLFIDIVGTGARKVIAMVPALGVFVNFTQDDHEEEEITTADIKFHEIEPLSSNVVVSWILDEVAKCLRLTSARNGSSYLTWNVALSMHTFWDGRANLEETESSLCTAFIVAYLNGVDMHG